MTSQSITKNFKEYSLINLILNKFKISYLKINSDTIGALASGLCMIHCVATPFFFIASACTASCCNMAPGWWQGFDYFFLFPNFQTSRFPNHGCTDFRNSGFPSSQICIRTAGHWTAVPKSRIP